MNLVSIFGREYVLSDKDIAEFLNSYVYIDMVEGGEMDAITPSDDVLAMLCEAINDEFYFSQSLLEFLRNR